jgi:hypothetical protein
MELILDLTLDDIMNCIVNLNRLLFIANNVFNINITNFKEFKLMQNYIFYIFIKKYLIK